MIADWKRLISGGMGCFCKHAVDPVADLHALFLGLDVNIAGSGFDRLCQDFVHQANDRSFLGHLRGLGVIPFQVIEHLHPRLAVLALRQQTVDRLGSHAQMGFDQLREFGRNRYDGHDAHAVAAPTASSA